MAERRQQSESLQAWKERVAAEPETLEGIAGVDIHVASRVSGLVQGIAEQLATSPNFDDTPSDQIAEAIVKGLSHSSFGKDTIAALIDSYRSE